MIVIENILAFGCFGAYMQRVLESIAGLVKTPEFTHAHTTKGHYTNTTRRAGGIVENWHDLKLVRMAVPLRDMESENLLDSLEVCLDFIDESRKTGSVLVHCFAGVSRRLN
ncbi:putative phosphoric monoester hydrolase [Helianthus annuus]|nr:putative phosphoric monoester hydrolase [Helianthus annuus]